MKVLKIVFWVAISLISYPICRIIPALRRYTPLFKEYLKQLKLAIELDSKDKRC